MAITFPATTLADGAVISKTFIDMIVDDINHLTDRPDASSNANGTAATATTSSYTQLTTPSVTVTPKRTGNMAVFGAIGLTHSAGGQVSLVRFDINGSKVGTQASYPTTTGIVIVLFHLMAVTANVAYTVKLEFNNNAGSGTMTAAATFANWIYAREAGA